MSSMKSQQLHRVIKDIPSTAPNGGSVKAQILIPINLTSVSGSFNSGNGQIINSNYLTPALTNSGKNVSFPKIIGNNLENNNTNDLVSSLQQRVKELEKENYKLSHHVSQAEQSIRNYREILTAHNLPTTLSNPSSIGNSKSNSFSTPAGAVEDLTGKSGKIVTAPAPAPPSDSARVASTASSSVSREKTCESGIENKIKSSQPLSGVVSESNKLGEVDKQLLNDLERKLEAAFANNSNLQQKLETASLQLIRAEDIHRTQRETLQKRNNDQELQIVNISKKLSDAQKDIVFRSRSQANYKENNIEKLTELSSAVKSLKSEVNTLKTRVKQELASCNKEVSDAFHAISEKSIKIRALMQNKSFKIGQELNEYKDQLQRSNIADVDNAKQQITLRYATQLQSAQTAVASLSNVHAAEIKAVKHLSHIKELTRIAKEREYAIEIDRMSIECKYLKEVQNILTFALNTAEQSLNELQPHVVVKLMEGRTNRIAQVEKLYRGKLKDVEQRSMETCNIVSGVHLEAFQKKATENEKTAEDMTKTATDALMELLVIPNDAII